MRTEPLRRRTRRTGVTRSRRTAWVVVAACAAALGIVWVASAARSEEHRARKLWESKEPAAYSFDYTHCGGMCAYCLLRVSVRNGRVTGVAARDGQCSGSEPAPTVERLFTMLDQERSAPWTDSIEVHYDPDWGFPDSIDVRCPPHTSDCGSSYRVTDFLAER